MIPGEIIVADGQILLNAGAATQTLIVANTGDRPVQVGSHYHFAESNPALAFDRGLARGKRLDIPAGTAVRFEPGQRQWQWERQWEPQQKQRQQPGRKWRRKPRQ